MKKVLFLIFTALAFTFASFSQCPTCQLPGWQYVKEITIDNSAVSASYSNFQELITIDTQTPVLQGKMNPSGNDIRFVDSDCSTPLCYYIESGMNTATTKIWVMLPALAANSTKNIFMFYGNAGAAAASNFSCVFPNVLTVTGAVTLAGNQNYDWIDIQSGSSVTVGAGQILSFKARKIIMAGNINGNNKGYGAMSGPGAGTNGGGSVGGSGGSYGGAGGSGGGGVSSPYGTANGLDIDMGSGGGGSDCNPNGGGGGAVKFEAAYLDLTGSISVNGFTTGGSCNEEAAGGGSGGGIFVKADYVNGNGSLEANGGNGQNSQNKEGGGGGAGGRIKIFYCKENNFAGATNVNGGQPGNGPQSGETAGANGTSTVNTYSCESITVGIEQFSTVANAGNDVAFCSGSTVTIGSASVPGYTYSWTPAAGLSDATISNPTVIITNNSSSNIVTDYVVTATSNGCSVTDTVQVTVYPLPTSGFSASGPVCVEEGTAIAYTGNADTALATFIWNFDNATILNNSGQIYFVSWDTSGSKNITLTVVQNGCLSSQQQVVITVNPPNANAGADQTFCSEQSITIGIPPNTGYTYSWSPANGLSNSTDANPTLTLINSSQIPVNMEYIVTTSYLGCTVTDTVIVTVNPVPVTNPAVMDVSYCSGLTPLIGTANNADYTYSWSPTNGLSSSTVSSPTVSLTNASATPLTVDYILTTDFTQYNCTKNDTVTVTVYQVPTSFFSIIPDSVCINEATTLSYTGNATSSAIYNWSFPGGNPSSASGQGPHSVIYSAAGTGIISLSVSENSCNSVQTNDSVIIKPFPVSNAGTDAVYCSGDSVMIGANSLGGHIYSWLPSAGLSNSSASNPYVNLTNFSQTPLIADYVVTTSLNNCISSDTVTVTVYQIPTSSFFLPAQVCGTESDTISYTGNATFNANYNWNFDGGTIISGSGQGAFTVYWQTTGKKYISLSVTENGCSSTTTTDSIDVFPLPVAIAGNPSTTFCSGSSFVLGTSSVPGYSYSWSPLTGLTDAAISNPTVSLTNTNNSIDTILYVLTVSANNCISQDSAEVVVVPIPAAYFPSPDGQCLNGNSFSFSGEGTFLNSATFSWNFGLNAIPSSSNLQNPDGIIFSGSGNFPVSLTITQHNCVSNVFVQNIEVYPMPSASFLPNDSAGCEPFRVNFFSNPNMPVTYQWNFGDFMGDTVQNPSHTYQPEGTYSVSLTIRTAASCSTSYSVGNIYVNPKPDAGFSYSPETITDLNPVADFRDESTVAINSWLWSFGDGTLSIDRHPKHFFPDTGTYIVSLVVTNTDGCLDTIIDTLIIYPDYNFFAPNAFSPNNDGKNDFFSPVAIGIDVSEYEMFIYNRWGELIFVTQSPDNPWDGKQDGKPVKEDVYVWIVNLRNVFKKSYSYKGHVAVVR